LLVALVLEPFHALVCATRSFACLTAPTPSTAEEEEDGEALKVASASTGSRRGVRLKSRSENPPRSGRSHFSPLGVVLAAQRHPTHSKLASPLTVPLRC
jgi:hypothetical protein